MELNKDFIGREFKPIAHEVSEDEVIAYASAIGARNLCYFTHDGADVGRVSCRLDTRGIDLLERLEIGETDRELRAQFFHLIVGEGEVGQQGDVAYIVG